MPILDFNKPKKIRSTEAHNSTFQSDSGVEGTYVPNMSEDDKKKFKAKHIHKETEIARIEIRKSYPRSNILVIVALDGWEYPQKNEYIDDRRDSEGYQVGSFASKGYNVRISVNGPLDMTFDDIEELNKAIQEAKEILENGV